MQDGELLVVDPSLKEEAAAAGVLTVVVNTHSDICSLNKTSGAGISMTQVSADAGIMGLPMQGTSWQLLPVPVLAVT